MQHTSYFLSCENVMHQPSYLNGVKLFSMQITLANMCMYYNLVLKEHCSFYIKLYM
jgi:hypothetical protein